VLAIVTSAQLAEVPSGRTPPHCSREKGKTPPMPSILDKQDVGYHQVELLA